MMIKKRLCLIERGMDDYSFKFCHKKNPPHECLDCPEWKWKKKEGDIMSETQHTPGPLDTKPDNQTVQQCCLGYGGHSFPGHMKEALLCHLSILKSKYPVLAAAEDLREACEGAYSLIAGSSYHNAAILDEIKAALAKAKGA